MTPRPPLELPPLYPRQRAAIYAPERYSLIEASTKCGKTMGCMVWLLDQAWTHGQPGRNYWWVAPIFDQAAIAFKRIRLGLRVTPAPPDINLTSRTIELPNGATLWFKSGDKPDSLYGEDVFAAVIDEASRVKEESFYAVRSTLTHTRGPIRIIGNVKGRKNWAYQLARKAEAGEPGMSYHTYDRYLSILRQSDAVVQQAAERALGALLDKIRQGQTPRAAIDAVMREFNADTLTGFREAFSAVLESALGVKEIKGWPVGGVKLSDRLYDHALKVSTTTRQIIEQHMKGLHNAQELRKALYEGYDFQQDPLNVKAPLPNYLQVEFDKFKAAALKTPALRAAYLEAIRKAEAGAGMDALEKVLKVAFYERNRYFANRIARTELHRNYTDQQAREWMAEDWVEYVQYRMSSKHPKADQCDAMANVDRYGLGPGIFPKADAPKPPLHPHCLCTISVKIDLINPKPKFNPNAERTFLRTLPAKEAAQVAGSFEKRRRILEDKETLEGIYNEGKDELYRWKRVGEVGQDRRMNTTPSVADIEAMPFDQARESVATIVASKEFERFATTHKDGEMPVAVLTELLKQALGASVKTVRLSRDDRDKQIRKGDQEGRGHYDLLQKMIDEGEVIQYREQAISLYEYEGEWYQAAIRRTNAGDELYLKSLRRADREQLERDRKRGVVIQKKYGAD